MNMQDGDIYSDPVLVLLTIDNKRLYFNKRLLIASNDYILGKLIHYKKLYKRDLIRMKGPVLMWIPLLKKDAINLLAKEGRKLVGVEPGLNNLTCEVNVTDAVIGLILVMMMLIIYGVLIIYRVTFNNVFEYFT